MTHILILTRHAKSDWSQGIADDHDRPLNARGRRAAPLIGQALHDRGLVPDQVLCSTATRARETWAGIAAALPEAAAPDMMKSLYHAAPETLQQALGTATGSIVALVAHNPGIAAFAHELLAQTPDHHRFGIFPTGATLIAEVADWRTLAPGSARLRDFFVPRDLPGHP